MIDQSHRKTWNSACVQSTVMNIGWRPVFSTPNCLKSPASKLNNLIRTIMSQSPSPLWPKPSTIAESKPSLQSAQQVESPTLEQGQAQLYMTQTLDLSS